MGGQWFNIGKNDEVARKNYVEITPEEQAEVDKALKAAQDAKLSQSLSNKQADINKGVKVEKQDKGVYTGNGITMYDNGKRAVIDWKEYDGSPQLFSEDTKIEYINKEYAPPLPKTPEKSFLDKLNDWGNRVTGGQIRGLGRGLATVGTVVGAGFLPAAGGMKVAAGGVILSSAAACSKDEFDTSSANVGVTNKKMADYNISVLNDPDNKYGLNATTDDGVEFKYGYDYNQTTDAVRPYITIGDNLKLYINQSPLTVPTAGNVIEYIDVIGDDLVTGNGEKYEFAERNNNPEVVFDNGITHNVGDDVDIKNDSTLGVLYGLLENAGFERPANNEVLTNFKPNEQGSFGNHKQGFSLSLSTPANLRTLTHGNPKVKGSIGGIDFSGQMSKDKDGNITIVNGDKVVTISQVRGSINIGTPDEPDEYNRGVVVSINGDEYFITPHGDGATDIGKIDRENGTTLQYYQNDSKTFDTQGAIDADNYYNDKQTNLREAQVMADSNYRYINQYNAGANADVNIRH